MKKLIFGLVIIALGTYGYSRYKNHEKFNTPNPYDYEISKAIDINYHNPMMVQNYIENTYKIGQFARNQWFNNNIDVKFADQTNNLSVEANRVYNTLLSTTKLIELKLENSNYLKNKGFDNKQIKEIEDKGLTAQNYYWKSQFKDANIKLGEKGIHIHQIQEMLISDSIPIHLDGIFNTETESAVQHYQKKHGLYPNGKINEPTLIEMYKKK